MRANLFGIDRRHGLLGRGVKPRDFRSGNRAVLVGAGRFCTLHKGGTRRDSKNQNEEGRSTHGDLLGEWTSTANPELYEKDATLSFRMASAMRDLRSVGNAPALSEASAAQRRRARFATMRNRRSLGGL